MNTFPDHLTWAKILLVLSETLLLRSPPWFSLVGVLLRGSKSTNDSLFDYRGITGGLGLERINNDFYGPMWVGFQGLFMQVDKTIEPIFKRSP